MRLLLAEDERSLSKALKAILEGNHYSVDVVYDGVEALFTCRYFSVRMTDGGTVLSVNTKKISAVDEVGAAEYAGAVGNREEGFYQGFRFLRRSGEGETLFVFLDRAGEIESFRSLLLSSILVALAGLLSVFVLLFTLSKRMIRPVSESYEKQRRFITDAGHEIKTPLTIISADADVLDMEFGKSEWLQDIRLQVQRLTTLTNDLIYLSKMEEGQKPLQKRGRSVYLDLYNTTPEISEETVRNLFDRFYRADPSRNSQTGGHGIGLSIVRAVVLAHKGEVCASSRDGRSLTVSVTLPAS